VEQGARFLITNYQFDNGYYLDFVERARAIGIEVPILAGVLPIFSVPMLENMAKLSGATITDELRRGLDALPEGDKEAVVEFGVDFAFRQCKELLEAGVPGLHFYTLDKSKATKGVVERLRAEGLV
jgi:methylenetetrahydrofolate reductase (NADPH)